MDWLTKQKTYVWLVVVLVIINITTLLFLWLGRPQSPEMNRDRKPDTDKFLKKELGLNEEQDQKLKQLRATLFDTTGKINDLILAKKKLIQEESFREIPDNEKVNLLAKEIGELESQVEILRYSHFTQVSKVLNVEQLKKFKEILGENSKHKPGPFEGERQGPPPPPRGEFPPPGR
jgi:hypothetical protein